MGDNPGPGVSARDLLTHVAGGPFVLTVDAITLAVLVAYLVGTRRCAAQGHRWPVWRSAAFAGGSIGIWTSVGSGLAVYSMSHVTLHAIRHVILMMTVPALVSLGRPLVLIRRVGGPAWRRALDAMARSRLVRAAGHPIPVWFAYLASMYLMLADRRFFGYMMSHPMVQDASTTVMVGLGLMYWGTLVASNETGRGLSYPARVISVLANMPFEVVVGIWLRYQMQPIGPMYSLGDTNTAGEAFIVAATLVSSLWLIAVVVQWLAEAFRQEKRSSAALEAGSAWTVPWWVENATPV